MQKLKNTSDKNSFREESIKLLKREAKRSSYLKSKKIESTLEALIKDLNPKSILFYLPLQMEANISRLIFKLRREKEIFVPFMEGVSFKMVRFRLPLFKKRFNILEPNNSFFKNRNIDLAIVPIVGMDRDFKRVGFGKGMYDRFFENLPSKPIVVFVQLKACVSSAKLTKKHDIRGDFLVTSNLLLKYRKDRFDSKYINKYFHSFT